MKNSPSVLFLGKKNDIYVEKALTFCRMNFDVQSHLGQWKEPLPNEIKNWRGDYIVSYLSRWILPQSVLQQAKIAAINFHPASPEYPGIGCTNFALYESVKEYGVTCHYMVPLVDKGGIIDVKRFPLLETDNITTLLAKTYDCQLVLFYEIMKKILEGKELPISKEVWRRQPLTRKELNQLGQITPDMSEEEILKRIRATAYGPWKPTVNVKGFIFELKSNEGIL
jgi:methionyl-tRNA formyltransferase